MFKTAIANLRAHKARMFLSSITVLLGVGFVAGTLILGDTIKSSFFDSFARRAQNVDAAVTPGAGVQAVQNRGTSEAQSLNPASLDAVKNLPGVASAEGRVFGQAPILGKDGKAVTNNGQTGFGINFPVDPKLSLFDMTSGRGPASPTEAAVDKATATAQHFALGDSVTVLDRQDGRHTFTLVGIFDVGTDKTYDDQSVVALQTPTAFAVTGRPGYDEIDVRAGPGVSQAGLTADLAALPAVSGPGYHVMTGAALAKALADSVVRFTDQFTTVLLVFALISVLVSALVIQNTFSILVAQRARELALLRCVGATRRQVFGGTLVEAAVFGLLASVGGFFAGIGLSRAWAPSCGASARRSPAAASSSRPGPRSSPSASAWF
jgi:putative ABC transport system permease protein